MLSVMAIATKDLPSFRQAADVFVRPLPELTHVVQFFYRPRRHTVAIEAAVFVPDVAEKLWRDPRPSAEMSVIRIRAGFLSESRDIPISLREAPSVVECRVNAQLTAALAWLSRYRDCEDLVGQTDDAVDTNLAAQAALLASLNRRRELDALMERVRQLHGENSPFFATIRDAAAPD